MLKIDFIFKNIYFKIFINNISFYLLIIFFQKINNIIKILIVNNNKKSFLLKN